MRLTRRRAGFTLIELMVVVIIVAILASAAVPIYLRYTKRSKTAEALVGLGAIRMAERLYKTEHGGYLAVAAGQVGNQPSDTPPGLNLDFTTNTYYDEDAFTVAVPGVGSGFTGTCDGSASGAPRAGDVGDIKVQMQADGQTRTDYGDGYGSWE